MTIVIINILSIFVAVVVAVVVVVVVWTQSVYHLGTWTLRVNLRSADETSMSRFRVEATFN